VPMCVSLLASTCKVFGLYVVFLSMRENSYGSVLIEAARDQRCTVLNVDTPLISSLIIQIVVSTGVYSIVRHPMYAGGLILYVAELLALGCPNTLNLIIIPVACIFWILTRLSSEEAHLRKNLEGYDQYCQKVNARLIPYIYQ
jgi:steroid 5-alpha reductase family enzyme